MIGPQTIWAHSPAPVQVIQVTGGQSLLRNPRTHPLPSQPGQLRAPSVVVTSSTPRSITEGCLPVLLTPRLHPLPHPIPIMPPLPPIQVTLPLVPHQQVMLPLSARAPSPLLLC